MRRQQIHDLYEWALGVCFRHPGKGRVPTAVVGVIHPRSDGAKEIRACADCVVAMEDIRREQAREREHAGEDLGSITARGGEGE
jgi:hypothetical protein